MNISKRIQRILLSIFSVALLFNAWDMKILAESSLTNGTATISWIDASGDMTISGDVLSQSVTNTNNNYATAQVNFSVGGDGDPIPAGNIQIRLPRYLYIDRDGNGVGNVTLGISDRQEGNTNFYYFFDGDEIVITNFAEISRAYMFTSQIQYSLPYAEQIKDGANLNLQASFEVSASNGDTLSTKSNELSLDYDSTLADITLSEKKVAQKYETWQAN